MVKKMKDVEWEEFRKSYLQLLGIEGLKSQHVRKAALERAYQMRTLEIELYWKRATYFWGFQIAAFTGFGVALGALFSDEPTQSGIAVPLQAFILVIAIFGFGSAWISLLGAKASKQWQLNWERHVDMLQDEFEGKLYRMIFRTAADGSQPMLSVTALNVELSRLLILCWLVLLGTAVWVVLRPIAESEGTRHVIAVGGMMGMLGLCVYNLFWHGRLSSKFRSRQLAVFGRHVLIERIE